MEKKKKIQQREIRNLIKEAWNWKIKETSEFGSGMC